MIDELKISEEKNTFFNALILFLFILMGFVIAQTASIFVALAYYGFDSDKLSEIGNVERLVSSPENRLLLLYLQCVSSAIMFIASPLAYLYLIEKRDFNSFNFNRNIILFSFPLVILISLSSMPLNALLIEWNAAWDFPDFMGGFESWASGNEEELRKLTEFLVDFDGIPHLLFGIFVIAVIPALGEEILFRGLLQNKLASILNIHFAIFLTAFIFSAIHLQFYGLIPRMFLGILFGYLYLWSGNLWVAIFAHFVNNAFAVVMMYLYKQELVDMDIEKSENIPLLLVLIATSVCVLLLYYFRSLYRPNAPQS